MLPLTAPTLNGDGKFLVSPHSGAPMVTRFFCAQTGTDEHFVSLCLDEDTMCSVEFEISILCCDVAEKKNYTLGAKDWDWTASQSSSVWLPTLETNTQDEIDMAGKFGAMPCDAMRCYVMLCYDMLCYAMLCYQACA